MKRELDFEDRNIGNYDTSFPSLYFILQLPGNNVRENVIWAKIPSVTDASAPRFHQCSPNYKYQQLLSFMAV